MEINIRRNFFFCAFLPTVPKNGQKLSSFDLSRGVHHSDMLRSKKTHNQIFRYQSELVSKGNKLNDTYDPLLTNAGRLQAKISQDAPDSKPRCAAAWMGPHSTNDAHFKTLFKLW